MEKSFDALWFERCALSHKVIPWDNSGARTEIPVATASIIAKEHLKRVLMS